MINQICDVMINISIWDKVHLWIYLQLIKPPNLANLNNLEDQGYVPGLLQFSNLPHLLNNQLCQDLSVSFFWNVEQGTIKICKCQLLKMARSSYIVILLKSAWN